MGSIIKDPSLAARGRQKIEWAKRHMQVLNGIAAAAVGLACMYPSTL